MYKWVQNTFALSEEGSRTFVEDAPKLVEISATKKKKVVSNL
ncbi:hypothetical protein [Fibrobacter sp. UWP2]|nr:hypothetical protein [Fibrobacter sp. UWP2]SHJ50203.1 hypothetical protein SAMN05720471_1498 [Fibrobacter sp. UWP2]